MKILLLNVPWYNGDLFGVRAGSRWPHLKIKEEGSYMPYPFFLGYSASLLKNNHFDVKIIDALANKIKKKEFIYLCKQEKPDLILIESSITSLKNDLEYAKNLKNETNATIIFSGPLNHFYTKDFFESHDYINYVLVGEYEQTLLNVVKQLDETNSVHHQKGLLINKGKNTDITLTYNLIDNLDLLPWPERSLIPMKNYNDVPGGIPLPSAQIIASRGCPFGCSFCMWPQIMFKGKLHRVRSPKDVVDEMEFLVKKLNFKSVYFDDDTFNIGKPRILEICNEIIKRKIKIPWAIMARADLMDEELLNKLKESGLVALKYGVETASKKLMEKIFKGLDLEKVISIVNYTHKIGIKTHLTFTFGIPGETWETINATIDLALKLNPHTVQFSILTPFPETKLYDQLKADNKILEDDFSKYDGNYGSVICTDALSKRDLENAIILAYAKWDHHKFNTQTDLVGELDSKNKIIGEFENERTEHKHTNKELQRLIKEINSLENTNKKTFNELQKHIKYLDEKKNILKNTEQEINSLKNELTNVKEINILSEQKIYKLNTDFLEHVKIVKNLNKANEETNSGLQKQILLLKELTINYKALLNKNQNLTNSNNLLEDSLKRSEKKYLIQKEIYLLIKKNILYRFVKLGIRKEFIKSKK